MPTAVRLGLAVGGYVAVVTLIAVLVWAKATRVQDPDDTTGATPAGRATVTEAAEELPATSGGKLVGSVLNSGETLAPGGYKIELPELPLPEVPPLDPPPP